ncbi:MAG: hypothetical protein KDH88_20175 [Chromatiales bacterium]|nr:hypothetical protein [Chromatiales bacterium]
MADDEPEEEVEVSLSGSASVELRLFPDDPPDPRQDYVGELSFALEPEWYWSWGDGHHSFLLKPFLRMDNRDGERTHADIREAIWTAWGDLGEVKVGIGKVFWGVAESLHLVDIVNQTDLVENIDQEDKLGQPMVRLSHPTDEWGTFDFYLLPGFRERTFPGKKGRLRRRPAVDVQNAEYESAAEQLHVDFALRWAYTYDIFDIGLAYFQGTGRDPLLLPGIDNVGNLHLVPYYEQIEQLSIDAQATLDAWLLKFEAYTRKGKLGRHFAMVGGFEYTFVGVAETDIDVGVLAEYLFNDRKRLFEVDPAFQNDFFVGSRIVLNDVQSTEVLIGVISDLDSNVRFWNIEASRRLGGAWKLSLEARAIAGKDKNDALQALRTEDYIQLELARYF